MSILNRLLSVIQIETSPQGQKTLRTAIILLVITLVAGLTYLVLAIQSQAWQVFALAASIFVYSTLLLVSVWAVRRRRVALGAWLILGGIVAAIIVGPLLVVGIGPVLAVTAIAMVSLVASQVLPRESIGRAVVVGITTALVVILLDRYGPANRLELASVQTITPILAALAISVLAFFVFRQFPNFSLRAKLIVSFLAISLLSVGVIAFSTIETFRQQEQNDTGQTLHQLAQSQAQAVGDILVQQVSILEAYRQNRILQNRVIAANSAYFDESQPSTEAILAQINDLDTSWQAAEDDDPLINERLGNQLAVDLLRFRREFPEHVEIFITDQYGALLASTNRTSDYYQGDEVWWQETVNNGQGEVYIGPPKHDESSNTSAFIISVPIYAPNSREVIGVMRSTYNIETIETALDAIMLSGSGGFDLYIPGQSGLYLHGLEGEAHETDVFLDQAPQILQELQSSPFDYLELRQGVDSSLVTYAPVTSVNQRPYIDRLGWGIIAHEDQDSTSLVFTTQAAQNNLILALIIALVAAAGGTFLAQRLSNPITQLTEAAAQLARGDFSTRATVSSNDEVGTLAASFNSMADQLQGTIGSLESRVAERTRELELVLELNRRLSGILNLNVLMQEMVTITKETFGYYHVHIYLLDERRTNLDMVEGYGQAGQQMKSEEHYIPLNHAASIVALAARSNSLIVVENVREDPNWLPNDLLPETRSEMAVPITLEGRVEGVLDVQSEQVGGLTGDASLIIQSLADQVAIAIRNARLFSQTEQALRQAQQLQNFYTHQAWEKFGQVQKTTDYEVRQSENLPPLAQISTPEAILAVQERQTVNLRLPTARSGSQVTNGGNGDAQQGGSHNVIATPLKIGDQVIGVLGVQDENERRQWSEDEIALIEAVSEQMSLALENARLFSESRQQAAREEIIANLTQAIWAGDDLQTVLRNTVSNLGETLKASKVVLRLHAEQDND
jgi:GAF domain-containing protein/HAMP domain-containing protein